MNEKLINQAIQDIYEDNFAHVDFMDNMGGECDCNIHQLLQGLASYIGVDEEAI